MIDKVLHNVHITKRLQICEIAKRLHQIFKSMCIECIHYNLYVAKEFVLNILNQKILENVSNNLY